jgi:hypothetical protein
MGECRVAIRPVAPARFNDIPAGAGYRFRVAALIEGPLAPQTRMYRWQVLFEGRQPVPFTTVDGDPAVVEFPTMTVGIYTISLDVGPPCPVAVANANAVLPNQRVVRFWVRAAPPTGRALPPYEGTVTVSSGTPAVRNLTLDRGYPVTIDPRDSGGTAIRAYYVQVSARRGTTRFEGYVDNTVARAMGFRALLDLSGAYDVLIVPDGAAQSVAPHAYAELEPRQIVTTPFVLEPGTLVTGTVRGAEGPIAGARVRLRSGALPSTVGTSLPSGGYELRVRAGRFEAKVVPPTSIGLPEAQVDAFLGLPIPEAPSHTVDFTYRTLPTARLDLTIATAEGAAPGGPIRVRLEALSGDLADVGIFTLGGGATVSARGAVRVEAVSSTGTVTFDKLPRARYQATFIPEGTAAGAVTTVSLDLREAPALAKPVTLARKSRILGRLTPADRASGLTILALDASLGAGPPVSAVVGADGRFELRVDPERIYRLFVEPPADRRLPRIPLGAESSTTNEIMIERVLPARLPLTGVVSFDGTPVSGAVVQIFCVGDAPDCVDPTAPNIDATRPLDENVSGPDGGYQLSLPDPGL